MHNKPARFQFFLQGWAWLSQQFRHRSVQHLLLAVIISIIIHAYFIQAIWHFLNPTPQHQDQNKTIHAHLQPLEKKILEKTPQKKIEKAASKKLEKKRPPTSKVNDVTPPEPIENDVAVENLQSIKDIAPTESIENGQDHQADDGTKLTESTELLASDAEDVLAKPYQYAESNFDVFMDVDGKPNRSPAGAATIIYQTFEHGEKYQIKNTMTAKGLAALIIPDLLQTSEGMIIAQGLKPQHYLYQFGTRKNKTYTADFNWQANTLILNSAKGSQTLDLTEDTQDLLSFMYQFMFVPPLNQMQINITNGKKLRQYDYNFDGEELLETKLGTINTLHLSHDAVEREEKTEIWLATDYRFLPVKIRKIEKQDKVYEMLVNSIKTDLGDLTIEQHQPEKAD